MTSQPLTTTPSLRDTIGALYIGSTIAAILFGVTNLQTVIYYKKYPDDWCVFRYSVALLWVLDALHVSLSTHALYVYLIDMFGDLAGVLVHSVWSFKVQLGINVSPQARGSSVSTALLADNNSHICSNVIFHPAMEMLLLALTVIEQLLIVAVSLGTGLFLIYEIYITPNFSAISDIKTAIYIFFAMATAADFAIAPIMWYYLHKIRVATDFSTTASLLLGLMRLVVVSGLAISACSLFALISYIMWPETLIFLGVEFVIPKLYINSLLAMFNYRREHVESSNSKAELGERPALAVLRITPHASEDSIVGTIVRRCLKVCSRINRITQMELSVIIKSESTSVCLLHPVLNIY
ncbi:hypothetical protein IW262DRAFT_1493179 [Armillaria fumosa]|nr:hypothetical protein IW262DRAFT_1493179 [Armillaria fumosa]